jgi:hypothetical protein
MGAKIRSRLTYANVMATVAVFIALGGSGYAAVKINGKNIRNKSIAGTKLRNRTISGGKLKKNTLTGAEIRESRLGTVPRAKNADSATAAGTAGSAATASNASALGGIAPSGFVRTPTDPTHLVGTPGNPSFKNGWANFGASFTPAGFYKDQLGVVHLQGMLNPPGSASTIFTLPPGYRPSPAWNFNEFGVLGDTGMTTVEVIFDGDVQSSQSQNNEVVLNGITFRAGG